MSLILKEIKPTVDESAHAFQIFSRPGDLDKTGNPKNYIVTIAPGTVNNILPQNIIDSKGALTEIKISLNTLNYVKLFFNTNGCGFCNFLYSSNSFLRSSSTAEFNDQPGILGSFKPLTLSR